MEAFLRALLPRVLPRDCGFEVHAFQGKSDLLGKLKNRLCGYAQWLPEDCCLFVIVDRDEEDCLVLKQKLENAAAAAGLQTRSRAGYRPWQLVNRIAIEELEAWYFGDWQAVRSAFPRVSPNVPHQSGYRDPDAIRGGTWEAFERVLRRYGYFKTGLRKVEAAKAMGAQVDPNRNHSRSFAKFREAIVEATNE